MLGVAQIVAAAREGLRGSVRILFQPAEEDACPEKGPYGGAYEMVQKVCVRAPWPRGLHAPTAPVLHHWPSTSLIARTAAAQGRVLDGVDEIYGLHLWSYAPLGAVGAKTGCVMAACDTFDIAITGRGGHGAAPHGTVDAIVVMAHVVTALQTIVSRNHDPEGSAVVTVGAANAGVAGNVICEQAHLKGTSRTLSAEAQAVTMSRMKAICDGAATMFEATVDLDYRKEAPALVNTEECAAKVRASARQVVGGGVQDITTMASEDFPYYLTTGDSDNGRPGAFFFVGASPEGRAVGTVPHHKPDFDIHEDSLLVGASVFVQLVEDLLGARDASRVGGS